VQVPPERGTFTPDIASITDDFPADWSPGKNMLVIKVRASKNREHLTNNNALGELDVQV
jgi:hypothetical protein